MSLSYTQEHIDFVFKLRLSGTSWDVIAGAFNAEFNTEQTAKRLKDMYYKKKLSADIGHEDADLSLLKHNRTVRVTNYKLRKEANIALDALNIRSDIMTELKKAMKKWPIKNALYADTKAKKDGKHAVLELLLSDLHVGQKTETFNFEVAERRLAELRRVFLWEVGLASERYVLDKIIIALLGDIIASFEFHGLQSAVTAEAVTPIQVVKAVQLLFTEIFRPIGQLGFDIEVPAVCGNHDRVLKDKPMNTPGQESITWIIYNMLKVMCETSGLNNIKFIIPNQSWCTTDIFGHTVLYEHADKKMRLDRKAANDKIGDRQTQTGKIISFFRFGHFHEYTQFGRGKAICNGTLVTDDGYSKELGFDTDAGQVISLYVESNKRPNPFYWSYLVSLSQIK